MDKDASPYKPVSLRLYLGLQQFEALPAEAHIRLPTVAILFGCSHASIWRWVKAEKIPAPKHFGARVSAWNVGEVREALKNQNR